MNAHENWTINDTLCAIWSHLYNLKTVKNTHGGVIFLVKLQASFYNFTKSITRPCVFFAFFQTVQMGPNHTKRFMWLMVIISWLGILKRSENVRIKFCDFDIFIQGFHAKYISLRIFHALQRNNLHASLWIVVSKNWGNLYQEPGKNKVWNLPLKKKKICEPTCISSGWFTWKYQQRPKYVTVYIENTHVVTYLSHQNKVHLCIIV